MYHRDSGHTGFDATLPNATGATSGWVSATLDQQVYAEPLVFNGIVFVATLNNTVYALNARNGNVVWSRHLRAPKSSGWSCGNVSPQGILGTPVIDPTTRRIYVATLGLDSVYRLEGLRLTDGLEQLNTVITSPAGGFDWTIEQERGALALANGFVYVPFGGRAGDCGNYHGYVFGVPTDGTSVANYYQTPGSGSGFWAAGGVVVDSSTGKVFETSGNGVASGCDDSNGDGTGTPLYENDAVVRLSATLVHEDAFYPADWYANWCINDQDLGSASPVLISPNLMFQAGKWGTGFLLNPNSLGGGGGELFPVGGADTANVCLNNVGNNADATFGSFAYAAPFVYVECEGQGLTALHVDTLTSSYAICDGTCALPSWNTNKLTGDTNTYGPPIVAGGLVWVVDSGNGLYGFNATTGGLVFNSAGFGVNRFVTPSEACGHIFVPAGNVVMSFNMTFSAPFLDCLRLPVGISSPAPSPPRPPIVQVSPAPSPPPR